MKQVVVERFNDVLCKSPNQGKLMLLFVDIGLIMVQESWEQQIHGAFY
jgi:hypothetical protein